jgi:hypothetical protein
MTTVMSKLTTRKVNDHLWCGQAYCYIDLPDGRRIRISRMRTRNGVREGRVINGSEKDWEPVPDDAVVELSY